MRVCYLLVIINSPNRKLLLALATKGVRSAMMDYQEIKGSTGNSSLLMDSKGHRIFFTLEDLPGYLEIRRSGWAGFDYSCVINDKVIPEATQTVRTDHEIIFRPKIVETTFTQDEASDGSIAWYVVRTTRLTDNVTTTVHRQATHFFKRGSYSYSYSRCIADISM